MVVLSSRIKGFKVDDASPQVIGDMEQFFYLSVSDLMGEAVKLNHGDWKIEANIRLIDPSMHAKPNRSFQEIVYREELSQRDTALYIDYDVKVLLDFKSDTFMLGGKEIYLTLNEKLLLLRILILKLTPQGGELRIARATIRRLRAKYGKNFPGLPK